MKVEQTLHQTTDYGMFKYIPQNRKTVSGHIAKLMQSIKTKNLNMDFPVIVNKQMEVLDGQNRLEAYKQLKFPVWYKFAHEMDSSHISLINTAMKNWTNDDFLNQYIVEKKEDYIKFKNFMEWAGINKITTGLKIIKDKKFNILSSSSREGGDAISGSDTSNFKSGNFKYPFNDSSARKSVIELKTLSQYTVAKDPYDRSLVVAYDAITKDSSFDFDRLVSKLQSYPLGVYNSANSLIDQFEKAYNYNVKDDKNKIFLKRAA